MPKFLVSSSMRVSRLVDVIACLGLGCEKVLTQEVLLADDEVLRYHWEEEQPGEYLNETFRRDPAQHRQFVEDLISRGMCCCVKESRCTVTPFFVSKKDNRLRVIWDCRCSNQFFYTPPGLDMGAGDALQSFEAPPGHTLMAGQADIANCYYQCKLPTWLAPYFTLLLKTKFDFTSGALLSRIASLGLNPVEE